jgi:hypothetical protein
LGEIGQVLRGPALPAGEEVAQRALDAGESHTSTVPSIPSRSTRSALGGGSAGAVNGSSRTAAGAPKRAVQAPSTSVPGQRPSRLPSPKGKRRKQGHAGPTTTTPGKSPSQPEDPPVRKVGKTVQNSVEPVPVVGKPAADAVGTVVDLISPPAPPPAPAPTTTPSTTVPTGG